jgi:hypothetical protein
MEQVKEVKEVKEVEEVEVKITKDIKDSAEIQKYIISFNEMEIIAYNIAKNRLKSSFDIEKSIGFKSARDL